MAARLKKIRHDDETRAKIKAAQIINRLMGAFEGKIDLTKAQVSIGLGLLKKVLPDLSQQSIQGVDGAPPIETIRRIIVDAGHKDG